ncbi:MAG: DUF3144 domain-containing protein [Betaproteobacteria bacterium HGW-Betaproteobacteria-20]|jgi:hypothetical protein|nr:MAG: DUF3144 domain-containing protein [Betaproteobacteria bacterium HGW-Betaproteobacteria-20]
MAEKQLTASDSAEAKPDDAFWRVADTFIASANEQAVEVDRGVVSAGFAYASARFNAFVIASQCGSKEAFEAEKAAAIEYFVTQYKLALTENVADYQTNFDTYINNASQ